ncbi:3-oxoacid CoA-transferase subunit A [Bacillus mangrovi]|uniref:3-oxoacid CoA-transferase subunit A n=1 Tax=Metabacillus mangrovi TaxID=1491830 RepID=A0A7X2S2E9_9BACI|nr:CoA transferase subunit A [Metabacillus mangrovi]MTH52030.1 3-oxoacid CoA-transferase subunit A [Metabacillus mangrovi]
MEGMNKTRSIEEAIACIQDGSSIMIGGFGGVGSPPSLIDAILEKGVKDLHIICNDAGFPAIGAGRLITAGRARKLTASHIGSNPVAGRLMTEGKLEVEFSPQGTLAERIRAGGTGLGGILTDIGIDIEEVRGSKQIIHTGGKEYLLEPAIRADLAILFCGAADEWGNLTYCKSARNMNPLMAMAADYTAAEAEEILAAGSLPGDQIVTPGLFIQTVVQSRGVNWQWVWEQK